MQISVPVRIIKTGQPRPVLIPTIEMSPPRSSVKRTIEIAAEAIACRGS